MKTAELLERLRAARVRLSVDGPDRLKVAAPAGALTDELKTALHELKPELIRLLSAPAASDQSIPVRSANAALTLSPNQSRIWALTRREPDSARFNLPFALRLQGELNVSALRTAINHIVIRHEVLRTRVHHTEFGPRVAVAEQKEVVQFEHAPADADEAWIHERVRHESERSLDPGNGECIRALLLQTAANDHVLLLVVHHLVFDGASFEIFFDELSALYAADVNGTATPLAPLHLQFYDVASWQQASVNSTRSQQAERFWEELFTPPPPPLALPQPNLSARALQAHVPMQLAIVERLKSLAAEEATSPFVVALAAYATMLSVFTGRDDLVLCTPTSGRDRDEIRTLIGYFNNVLPLRVQVNREVPFRDTVRATRQRVLDAQQHEQLPFQRIAALSATNRLPLTRGMFALHGTPLILPRLASIHVEQMDLATGTADFDLGFTILPHEGGLRCTVQHRESALGQTSGDHFLASFLTLLDRATQHPQWTGTALIDGSDLAADGSEHNAAFTTTHTDGARWSDEPTEVVLAGDPLELQLTLIWEHALRIRPIAPEDNFFDLGGHSLLAVQILDTIEREMGVRMTLAVLVSTPTVRTLAKALRNLGWRPAEQSLVLMQTGPDVDPIIFVHSFEGHTFVFNELVRQFGGRVPTYGLQMVGLGDETPLHLTVEQMASHYLEQIDQQFGSAPVSLVGMCFGFSVCLEMAKRRAAQGKQVRLIMIDGAWDHFEPGTIIGDDAPLIVRLKRALHRAHDHAIWMLDTLRRGKSDSLHARREAAIRRRTITAWYKYHPKPYDGHITLIRALETANDAAKNWQIDAMEAIAGKGLHTVVVPGHHLNLLRSPHAAALANELLKAAGVDR